MGNKNPLYRVKFYRQNIRYYMRMQYTGNTIPQPVRIVIDEQYWADVGGERGWDTRIIYDKAFEDRIYAGALFKKILEMADPGTVLYY